jgi:RNA polymerase sigma-70 factor (ECF subfamily)
MADGSDSQTSTTLLRWLRDCPTDAAAWERFADRYGGLIYRWCRRWGLQEADAEDVTQNVLLELLRQMRTFAYDRAGSFRAWLRTVAYRAWCRFVRDRHRRGAAAAQAAGRLHSAASYEDLLHHLLREDDREVLDRAMAVVRLRVQPHTWDAFRLLALDGRSGQEAAAALAMTVGAAYVARSKVQKMIRDEITRMNEDDDGTAARRS